MEECGKSSRRLRGMERRFYGICVGVLLAVACCWSTMTAGAAGFAWADDGGDVLAAEPANASNEQLSGLEQIDTPDWAPSVSVSFDHGSYGAGDEMLMTLTGVNDGPATIRNVDLTAQVPAGLTVVSGASSLHAAALAPSETLTISAVVMTTGAAAGHAPVSRTPAASAPVATGDALFPLLMLAALALVAVAVTVIARRRAKMGSDVLSMVLALVLAVGLVPTVASPARADDVAGAGGEADVATPLTTGTGQASITVDGIDYQVAATLSVGSADEVALDHLAYASLTAADAVAASATTAQVEIDSDQPFAQEVSASSVTLGDGFANCVVQTIDPVPGNDKAVLLTIAGTVGDGSDFGTVDMAAGAFADQAVSGFGVVSVFAPEPTVGQASVDAHQGYLGEGCFAIPVNLDSAEFVGTPAAIDFSLGDTVQVESAAPDGRRDVVLTVLSQGATPEAQFATLDKALTEHGVKIAATATNCGALTAWSADASPDEGVTALEYVNATPTVSASVSDVSPDADGTDLVATCALRFQALNGAVTLKNVADVALLENDGEEGGCLFDAWYDQAVQDDNTLSFSLAFDGKDLLDAVGDADGELDENEKTLITNMITWMLSSHAVVLENDALRNAWGVPQNGMPIEVDYGAEPALAANALGANDTSVEQTAFEMVQDLMDAAGGFVNAYAKEDPGELFRGGGSVIGMIAKSFGLAEESLVTLEDVMKALDKVESSLQTIDAKVSALSTQLRDMESRQDYQKDVRELQRVLGNLSAYCELVQEKVQSLDKTSEAASFAVLSSGDQRNLEDLAKGVTAVGAKSGSTSYADTMSLGRLIAGEGTIGAKSVVDEYDDWLGTYYNWEPETFEARKTFITRVGEAYVVGYIATMGQLEVQINKEADKGTIDGLRSAQKALVDNMRAVVQVLRGTKDEKGNLVKSSQVMRTEARTDGKVLNLVTNQLFSRWGFTSSMYDSLSRYCKLDIDDVPQYRFDGSLSQANWETMIDRLPAVRKRFPDITTLHSELRKWGFEEPISRSYNFSEGRCSLRTDEEDNHSRYIAGDATRKCTKNRRSVEHTYRYYGTYCDIDSDRIVRDAELYVADSDYHSSKARWYTTVTLHNFLVARSG